MGTLLPPSAPVTQPSLEKFATFRDFETEGSHSGNRSTEIIPVLRAIPTVRTEADLTKELVGSEKKPGGFP